MPMRRIGGCALLWLTVGAGGATVTSACAHDGPAPTTLFVFDVLTPSYVGSGSTDMCLYNNDPSQRHLSLGTVDIDFVDAYVPTFLVGCQIDPQGQNTASLGVVIGQAIVRITDSQGAQLNTYTAEAEGTITFPNGTSSYGPAAAMIIDQGTMTSPSVMSAVMTGGTAHLLTYVRFTGKTSLGEYLESPEFKFPVDVCKGCLIAFPPQDVSPDVPAPNCGAAPAPGSAVAQTIDVPCILGQDISIDCSKCPSVPDCAPNGPYNNNP
jgi:hypothetical protein